MRILTLSGKNLASLRDEFRIDFDREPLSNAGLFAITGATGAGKSTLLDAICLPLYNQLPRLKKAYEQGKVIEQSGEHNKVYANDARQILRRGAGEGYASVRFQTPDGKIYTALWEVWRAGRRPDGALQPERLTLKDGAGNLIADSTKRSKDYLQTLQRIIGLSFEQFTSAILLAQGEFAAFLEAKSNDKSTLLELLTHTERFSQISMVIFKRYNDLKKEREQTSLQIEQIGSLTEEEKRALDQQIEENNAQCKLLQEQSDTLHAAIEWYEKAKKLAKELNEAELAKEQKKLALLQLEDKYSWVKIWEVSQEIRQSIRDKAEIEKKLASLKVQCDADQKELEHIETQAKQLEKRAAEWQERYVVLEKERIQLEHTKEEITELDRFIQKSEGEIKSSEKKCAEIVRKGKEVAKQFAEHEKRISVLEEKLRIRNEIVTKLSPYQSLYERLDILELETKELLQDAEIISTTRAQHESYSVSVKKHQERSQALEEKLKMLAGCDSLEVITLRALLQPGAPCPVCGSTMHVHGKEAVVTSGKSLEELEAESASVKETLEHTKVLLESDKEAMIRAAATLNDKQRDFDKTLASLQSSLLPYQSTLPAVLQFSTLSGLADAEWKTTTEQCLKKLLKELAQVSETRKQWLEQQKYANLEGELEQAKAHLETYRQQREDLLVLYKEENERKELQENEGKQYKEKLAKLTLGKTVLQLEEELRQKEVTLAQDKEKYSTLEHSLNTAKEQKSKACAETTGQIKELQVRDESLSLQISNWYASHRECTQEALLLVDQHTATEVEQYKKSREQEEQEFQRLQGVITERQKQKEEHEQQRSEATKRTQEKLEQEYADCVSQKNKLVERGQDLSLKRREDDKNKTRRAELQKILEDGKELYEHWAELDGLFGSNNGRKFREIAQSYTLQDLITYANEQLQQIMPRYQLERSDLSQQNDRQLLVLNIVDTQMMGVRRNVDTLSGGEKFIVSLALSLALSSIAAHSNTIEMLFIDEGFGTLDPNHLRMVLEALEHLEQQGRRIGLISHVAELNESIPLQICVEKIDGDSSRIVVSDRR